MFALVAVTAVIIFTAEVNSSACIHNNYPSISSWPICSASVLPYDCPQHHTAYYCTPVKSGCQSGHVLSTPVIKQQCICLKDLSRKRCAKLRSKLGCCKNEQRQAHWSLAVDDEPCPGLSSCPTSDYCSLPCTRCCCPTNC